MQIIARPLARPATERDDRDYATIELAVVLVRDLLYVPDTDGTAAHDALVEKMSRFFVLDLLLLLACGDSDDDRLRVNDMLVLECVYLLLAPYSARQVARACPAPPAPSVTLAAAPDSRTGRPVADGAFRTKLAELLAREHAQRHEYLRKRRPTRHARFGGSFQVHLPTGLQAIYHGPVAYLEDSYRDSHRLPRRRPVPTQGMTELADCARAAESPAAPQLRTFCERFLLTCYNRIMGVAKVLRVACTGPVAPCGSPWSWVDAERDPTPNGAHGCQR